MTTICDVPAARPEALRYAAKLVRLHQAQTYPGLADAVQGEPLCRLDGYGDGLTTVSFHQSQLPEDLLRGVLGFRLAQFLQTGLIDPELVHRRALSHEPIVAASGPETIHTVTLDESGRIVGYVAMVGSPDPRPLPLNAPGRGRFPAEIAHRVDLLSGLAMPGLTTHHAYEIKRFVRSTSMPRGAQRDRVPWHLIRAVGGVTLARGSKVRIVLGDSGERGALRHLRLVGLDLEVVEGTSPELAPTELMWVSYHLPSERRAKPFVGVVPADAAEFVSSIETSLAAPHEPSWQRQAVERLIALNQATGRRFAWGLKTAGMR
jgi:hypothetical protein